ncbi:transmembrane protein 130-like [Tetranychus urticae]|uniref:transmembrane protein 130-like n=1 Tax=Tetranychus urticae TaxID=32264 RepID=UPI00077BFE41|nr:transmembrane protein 130-like [Tetranychus urticae]
MRNLSAFILCIISFINGISCDSIEIQDDGPATLDSPITFTVINRYPTPAPSLEYRIKFDQFPQHDKTIVSSSVVVEYSVIFESSLTPKADKYTMQVDVWFLGVDSRSVANASHTFELSDSLVGSITRYQRISYEYLVNNFVSTEMPVKLTAEIADPSGFFTGRCGIPSANITYKWIINGSPQEESSKVIEPTFSEPQLNNISVIVSATKTNGSRLIQKSGSFNITLNSKHPITNATIDGPTEVKVFERLQLDFKIHRGTPPFQYRYFFSMDQPNSIDESGKMIGINESSFSIIKTFSEKGTREFHIALINDVSAYRMEMNIKVH